MRISLLAALAALAAPEMARAQAGPHDGHSPPTVRVARATEPVQLDGRPDEAAWDAARPVTTFTQRDPDEGRPASEASEARVLYDDEALYVAVRFHDRDRVRTRLGRRDMGLGDSDWVGVVIDSYHDHQTAFAFWVNPSGVRRDATRTDGGDDLSWDAVWVAEAARPDSGGWTAELRIPFSQLRFNPDESTWGLQIERTLARRGETAVLSFTPRAERAGIARFGHLEGLTGVRTGRRLEVLPYTVARTERIERGSNPFREDVENGVSMGLDLKYRVTSDLTLDATVNPDFGQVELDPATVNLTQFEVVFAEKRPFFVEGSEIFQFGPGQLPTGGGLFYTRRIGGRASALEPGVDEQDVPTETGILAAAKLSGKTASGWSVGVLNAVTSHEEARFLDESVRRDLQVEPLTNFFVGRVKKDLRGGQSYVGGIVTAVNRRLETDALRAELPSAGFTAGLDFRHEFGRRAWSLAGWVAGTHVRGDSLALSLVQQRPFHYFQRPDAGHLELETDRESLTGVAGAARLTRQAGAHWRGSVGAATISPGFDLFDIGTQRRGDRVDLDGSLTYLRQTPGSFWRYWELGTTLRREWNYDLEHIFSQAALIGFFQHLSLWSANFQLTWAPTALDDRLTRGGPLAGRPWTATGFLGLSSDPRKPITVGGGTFHQWDDAGGSVHDANVDLTVKSSPRWNVTVGPFFAVTKVAAQFLGSVEDATPAALYGRRYLFTDLEQRTLTLNTRVNYTFTPELSLEVFLQPFIAAVDFGERTRYLAAPRTFRFEDDDLTGVRGTDFNVRSLRGNAVLRWEYRPGSTLYVAWQQQRESFAAGEPRIGEWDLARDRRALFDADPDNVLVVKVNYWLNP